MQRRQVCNNNEPLVRELFEIVKTDKRSLHQLSVKSGFTLTTLSAWFAAGHCPRVNSFVAVAQMLGYDVVLMKRNRDTLARTAQEATNEE